MAIYSLTVPNKNGSYDGDMVVKQYTSLTIGAGNTLTTDQPCRGLLIYVQGNCTISGILSMTARGAAANPTVSGASDANAVDASGLRLPFATLSGSDTLSAAATLLNGCGTTARTLAGLHRSISSNGTIITVPRSGGSGGASVNPGGNSSGNTGGTASNSTGGGGSGGRAVGALPAGGPVQL